MDIPVRRALISVSDKAGLVPFARELARLGATILSTGGTARLLGDNGVAVTEVGQYTGFPEMLDGRVKTLHPKVHAGILARRDVPAHMNALRSAGIEPIDLVVVNLYPFRETIARPGCDLAEAIENIDIGGPSMLRAAAKNCSGVAAVADPEDYPGLIEEMRSKNGALSSATRMRLAKKAFAHTAAYDAAISNYLGGTDESGPSARFPEDLTLQFHKLQDLRYGENPHQAAAFYRDEHPLPGAIASASQLQGKELSYNNIADADAAWECVKTLDPSACVIVKHANPCGASVASGAREAYERAFATDPTSAFGGIIAFNRPVDGATAEAVCRQFAEVVIAPDYDAAARAAFATKSNLRLLAVPGTASRAGWDLKRVAGGLLVQSPDADELGAAEVKVVTRAQPRPDQLTDMLFAWRIGKFVKSNAIVFVCGGRTLGVGAGQMSRVDSARIATIKAQNSGLSLRGSAVASDAFFPFRDGVDVVAEAGATAIIQPGGSVRDDEVIAAADERGIAMVFTGVRHFRH
jgi:phosphoribosylaminoimidazolecarboxamide formyltransferase/IMP cyclohydrolase